MSNNIERPWWYPVLCDEAYCKRLRHDYGDDPEIAAMSDEELIEHYNDGRKYKFLADHVGDAYDQFEQVAGVLLAAEAVIEKAIPLTLTDAGPLRDEMRAVLLAMRKK